MAELSTQQRAEAAAKLIEQAPPGEVKQIIADDDALMPHAGTALRAYNLSSLTVVEHETKAGLPAHTSVLSQAALVREAESERYIDPVGKQSFRFDHLTMAPSDYEPHEIPEEEETFRADLAKSLLAYTKNHYATGVSSVQCSQYPLQPPVIEPAASSAAPPAEKAEEAKEQVAESNPTSASAGAIEAEADVSKLAISDKPTSPTGEIVVEEGTAISPEETAQELKTDVVPEQVAGGAEEPAPTPGTAPEDSVVSDSAPEMNKEKGEKGDAAEVIEGEEELEKVDEGVKEAKGEVGERSDTPQVEEDDGNDAVNQGMENNAEPVDEPARQEQKRDENPIYTLEVVGNKYKTDAFWTGRWRSRWTVDKAASLISGHIQVDVHYFEQGNVQLATEHRATFTYPSASDSQSIPSQIVTEIAKIETAYQMELQDVYGDLGEKAFRSLRRALPITRHKIDWEKVGGYNLRTDIGQATA